MLLIEYRCPVDGWPLYYDPAIHAYRCGACPQDWGPGAGVAKDNCRVMLGKGTGARYRFGGAVYLSAAGAIHLLYDRGTLRSVWS